MITQAEFRQVLGHFATGVTIVTTCDEDGHPKGFTANAFTSLSLNPPMVLICVDQKSQTHPVLQAPGAVFTVNILTQRQEALSRVFASKREDKFESVPYRIGLTGAPILDDVLAFLECRVVDRLASGDHTIIVGEVHDLGTNTAGEALLYYRGNYAAAPIPHQSVLHTVSPTDSLPEQRSYVLA